MDQFRDILNSLFLQNLFNSIISFIILVLMIVSLSIDSHKIRSDNFTESIELNNKALELKIRNIELNNKLLKLNKEGK
jgi:uncharacterized membrane protein